jgi:copper(I)-binding protein
MRRSALLAIVIAPVFLLSSVGPALAAPKADVTVSGAWVKASDFSDHIGGMTGVFAKITNNTRKTISLVGGTSTFAPMVDVHQVVNGVMSHKPGGVEIKPGKSAILEPGGLHVMLMGLSKKILPGTRVDLKLNFKGAKSVALKLTAKATPAGAETYSPAPMSTPTATPDK